MNINIEKKEKKILCIFNRNNFFTYIGKNNKDKFINFVK